MYQINILKQRCENKHHWRLFLKHCCFYKFREIKLTVSLVQGVNIRHTWKPFWATWVSFY